MCVSFGKWWKTFLYIRLFRSDCCFILLTPEGISSCSRVCTNVLYMMMCSDVCRECWVIIRTLPDKYVEPFFTFSIRICRILCVCECLPMIWKVNWGQADTMNVRFCASDSPASRSLTIFAVQSAKKLICAEIRQIWCSHSREVSCAERLNGFEISIQHWKCFSMLKNRKLSPSIITELFLHRFDSCKIMLNNKYPITIFN